MQSMDGFGQMIGTAELFQLRVLVVLLSILERLRLAG
jgi:hypothetical protein